MRALIQRVSKSSVVVDQQTTGAIATGLLVLLGVEKGDTEKDLRYTIEKTTGLRIFEDEQGKMNLSLLDVGGQMLVVSQFTLLGDVRRGRRPSFVEAASPEIANRMYEEFINSGRELGIDVQTGIFQAEMQVALVNEGPVTILIDSRKRF
ncbi:MAG: D-aminoacyl-tRNA deacylase [Mariniblastus sp.]|nr:D-aminoacyl-tRNA deacylase [Mariniblastus sp.]